jgi:hypothetical protein
MGMTLLLTKGTRGKNRTWRTDKSGLIGTEDISPRGPSFRCATDKTHDLLEGTVRKSMNKLSRLDCGKNWKEALIATVSHFVLVNIHKQKDRLGNGGGAVCEGIYLPCLQC